VKLGEHGGSYGALIYKYRCKVMEILFRPLTYDKGSIVLCVMQFEIM
jgi:hypothetical protein